ncbi:MAG: response regulator transcription factor [Ignavibacteriaceae bacterium]
MINVVVIEDNDTIREGLKILINETEGYYCEEAYPNHEQLFKNIDRVAVNVLLIDIGPSSFQVINAIKKIKSALPDLTILILTLYEENALIFDGLCAGASGYIVKRTPPEKLLQAIRDAYYGGVPMSSDIARKVISFFQNKKPSDNINWQITLTDCEYNILNKLVEGNSFKVISDSLNMSVEDIRFSLKDIYKKLHKCAEIK